MASIITNNYRIANLKEFFASLRNDCWYFAISHTLPWVAEPAPDAPIDSRKANIDFWNQAMAAKRITDLNARQGIILRSWQTGQYYDMYRHDYNGTITGVSLTGSSTTPGNLYAANYFVVDPATYRVYKCLYNRSATTNLPIASTVLPTITTPGIQTTGDGYQWIYMFTVTTGDVTTFATPFFIPSPEVAVANLVDGGIYEIVVTAAGAYSVAPTVVIHGDGTGATAHAVLNGGGITHIVIDTPGSGYNIANITFTGGTGAGGSAATAIISPLGGHGSRPAEELGGIYALLQQQFISSELGSRFTVANDFRQIGIIKNPVRYAVSGTVGVLADSSGNPTPNIIGDTTAFTSQVTVGDILRLYNTTNGQVVFLTVASITSDTVLTATASPESGSVSLTPAGYTVPTVSYEYDIIPGSPVTQTLCLTMTFTGALSGTHTFVADATITGAISNAKGRVVDYNTTTHTCRYFLDPTISGNIVPFQGGEVVSDGAGQSGTIATLVTPDIKPYIGDLVYYDNFVAIERAAGQAEDFKAVMEF